MSFKSENEQKYIYRDLSYLPPVVFASTFSFDRIYHECPITFIANEANRASHFLKIRLVRPQCGNKF